MLTFTMSSAPITTRDVCLCYNSRQLCGYIAQRDKCWWAYPWNHPDYETQLGPYDSLKAAQAAFVLIFGDGKNEGVV